MLLRLAVWQSAMMFSVFAAVVVPALLIGRASLVLAPVGIGLLLTIGVAGWLAWWPACLVSGAVSASVGSRADKESITSAQALGAAWTRRRLLVGWITMTSIQGPANGLHDRYGVLESRIRWTSGLGWGLGTCLAMPVLILEGEPASVAVRRSVALVRDRLGITTRSHIRPFVQWSYGAIGPRWSRLPALASSCRVTIMRHTSPCWPLPGWW